MRTIIRVEPRRDTLTARSGAVRRQNEGMTQDDDLPTFTAEQIEQQLAELTFDSFDQEAAYALGTLAAEIVRERGFALAVQIVIGDHIVYKAALGDVEEGTTEWLRRKSNVARRDGVPSLLVRRRAEALGEKAAEDADHAPHGGAFPIVVDGTLVGTITGSGQPDVVDHDVVVSALRSYLAN
ncbi:hypothetical protein AS850_14730 [Frondihabitans sp. 762G35]|nr:hypothetical protein AS850_14730 [Frondihabitans sp. 762G35]